MIKKKVLPVDRHEGVYGITAVRKTKKVSTAKRKVPVAKAKAVEKSTTKRPPSIKKKLVKRKAVLLPPDQVSYIPDLNILYDRLELPTGAEGLHLENAVSLSEELLQFVKTKTEARTRDLSNLILRSSIPSMLACDASIAYTKTFLESGFGFSTTPDETIPASLADLVRFEVIAYFIRVSRLPKVVKTKLLDTLTDKFSEQIITTMRDSLQKKKLDDKVKDMEAFVMRTRSNNKVTSSKREAQAEPSGSGRGSMKRRVP